MNQTITFNLSSQEGRTTQDHDQAIKIEASNDDSSRTVTVEEFTYEQEQQEQPINDISDSILPAGKSSMK